MSTTTDGACWQVLPACTSHIGKIDSKIVVIGNGKIDSAWQGRLCT